MADVKPATLPLNLTETASGASDGNWTMFCRQTCHICTASTCRLRVNSLEHTIQDYTACRQPYLLLALPHRSIKPSDDRNRTCERDQSMLKFDIKSFSCSNFHEAPSSLPRFLSAIFKIMLLFPGQYNCAAWSATTERSLPHTLFVLGLHFPPTALIGLLSIVC